MFFGFLNLANPSSIVESSVRTGIIAYGANHCLFRTSRG